MMKRRRILKKLTDKYYFTIILYYALPSEALASSNAVEKTFCNIIVWFSGESASGLETLSIIMVGLLALQNRVSIGLFILHVLAIGLLHGAGSVVWVIGSNTSSC